jgi:hypothetical protein
MNPRQSGERLAAGGRRNLSAVLDVFVTRSTVNVEELPEGLRPDLLSYLKATSEERARLIGDLGLAQPRDGRPPG